MTHSVDFSAFNDVENPTLRAWNRCSMFFNICQSFGKEKGKEYVQAFPKSDMAKMAVLFNSIVANGYEETKAQVMRDNDVKEH